MYNKKHLLIERDKAMNWIQQQISKRGYCLAKCGGPEALEVVMRDAEVAGADVKIDNFIDGDPEKGGYYAQVFMTRSNNQNARTGRALPPV